MFAEGLWDTLRGCKVRFASATRAKKRWAKSFLTGGSVDTAGHSACSTWPSARRPGTAWSCRPGRLSLAQHKPPVLPPNVGFLLHW